MDTDQTPRKPRRLFRTHIALTNEHGSWALYLGPLIIGLFAGGSWTPASGFLVAAATAAFLVRHPLTILVKVFARRRARHDLPAALFWASLYALVALAGAAGLYLLGFGYLFLLAVPGVPIFIWYLVLVSRRSERRQLGVELVASGVLALAAPAAYWVGTGQPGATGWWLWLLVWAQSAASIVYAYLRLSQRRWDPDLPVGERFTRAWRAVAYTTFNLTMAIILGAMQIVPQLLALPFALQWLETFWGTLRPAVRVRPTLIGIRQLLVTIAFTLSFILAWSL